MASHTTFADLLFGFVGSTPSKVSSSIFNSDWSQLSASSMAFEWSSSTPLADVHVLPAVWLLYWGTLFLIQTFMESRPAFVLKWSNFFHNLILTAWSAIMFCGLLYEMYSTIWVVGINSTFCEKLTATAKGPIFYWMYIYYLSKFYELLDTVFMVLKKKKLTFLHVYHHTIVIAEVWSWMHYSLVFGSWGMLVNTGIHVLMYFYFALTCLKINPWWKRYITKAQILQFAASFMLTFQYLKLYFVRLDINPKIMTPTVFPFFPWIMSLLRSISYTAGCSGGPALAFSVFCNFTFLVLFIRFESETYEKRPASSRAVRPAPIAVPALSKPKLTMSGSPSSARPQREIAPQATVTPSSATTSIYQPAVAMADIKSTIQTSLKDVEIATKVISADVRFLRDEVSTSSKSAASDVTSVKGDVTSLTRDITAVRGDITAVQGDVTALNGDVTSLARDVATLQGDVAAVQGDVTIVKGEVAGSRRDAMAMLEGIVTTLKQLTVSMGEVKEAVAEVKIGLGVVSDRVEALERLDLRSAVMQMNKDFGALQVSVGSHLQQLRNDMAESACITPLKEVTRPELS